MKVISVMAESEILPVMCHKFRVLWLTL